MPFTCALNTPRPPCFICRIWRTVVSSAGLAEAEYARYGLQAIATRSRAGRKRVLYSESGAGAEPVFSPDRLTKGRLGILSPSNTMRCHRSPELHWRSLGGYSNHLNSIESEVRLAQ